MGIKRITLKALKYLVPTILVLLIIPFSAKMFLPPKGNPFERTHITCALAIGNEKLSEGYVTGFNYEMLTLFAESLKDTAEIFLADSKTSYLDSLLVDSLDVLVLPASTKVDPDKFQVSQKIGDSAMWVIKSDNSRLKAINRWISSFEHSEKYAAVHARFFNGYNPYRRTTKKRGIISPYDELIKKNAASIGWDWRMLASLIWSESKFRIQASSHKGALGLMQMVPRTADRYGVENDLDPAQNIKAGTQYIIHLQKMFRGYASSPEELTKITLAAYNSGEGKILDCLGRGDYPNSKTSAYVNAVMSMYRQFCGISSKKAEVAEKAEAVADTASDPFAKLDEENEKEDETLLSPDSLGRVNLGDEKTRNEEKKHNDKK